MLNVCCLSEQVKDSSALPSPCDAWCVSGVVGTVKQQATHPGEFSLVDCKVKMTKAWFRDPSLQKSGCSVHSAKDRLGAKGMSACGLSLMILV